MHLLLIASAHKSALTTPNGTTLAGWPGTADGPPAVWSCVREIRGGARCRC